MEPVWRKAMFDRSRATARRIVQRVPEALELPGTASDYHHLLVFAADSLYKLRFSDPTALSAAERFSWLDVDLIEARPAVLIFETGEGTDKYSNFSTFSTLITLYSTDGYLREALAVAEKGERFDQTEGQREEILRRISAIEAENER
jgi:hypothetical protein